MRKHAISNGIFCEYGSFWCLDNTRGLKSVSEWYASRIKFLEEWKKELLDDVS